MMLMASCSPEVSGPTVSELHPVVEPWFKVPAQVAHGGKLIFLFTSMTSLRVKFFTGPSRPASFHLPGRNTLKNKNKKGNDSP